MSFLAVAISLPFLAQSVGQYKYVQVPVKFEDFKTNNQYNLNKILVSKLSDKQYAVTQEEAGKWPMEFPSNTCEVLSAEVQDISTMFRNKVRLELKDCQGKVVGSYEAMTYIKEFHEGYQDALLKAIDQVPVFSGSAAPAVAVAELSTPVEQKEVRFSDTPFDSTKKVESTNEVAKVSSSVAKEKVEQRVAAPVKQETAKATTTVAVNTQPVQTQTTASNNAETYTFQGKSYTKVNLGEDYFILTQPNSSVPFAQFRESSQKGVYRVSLADQTSTIGFLDGNNLVIELSDGKGGFVKQVFVHN